MSTTTIDWADAEAAAKLAAGNWKKFESFAWHQRPDDSARWYVGYTHNRDSGLTDQSNGAVIAKEMMETVQEDDENPDVRLERHNHWACGWVDGVAIRVYDEGGNVTAAFRRWCHLQARLSEYGVLDEDDLSERQLTACLDWIRQEGKRLAIPLADKAWPELVYDWLDREGYSSELEDRDDTGATPSEDSIRAALASLGICQCDELPVCRFPKTFYGILKMRIDDAPPEKLREVMKEVLTALLDWNGRPAWQIEHSLMVLQENNLWPEEK